MMSGGMAVVLKGMLRLTPDWWQMPGRAGGMTLTVKERQ
jgi:hypothetical protein